MGAWETVKQLACSDTTHPQETPISQGQISEEISYLEQNALLRFSNVEIARIHETWSSLLYKQGLISTDSCTGPEGQVRPLGQYQTWPLGEPL